MENNEQITPLIERVFLFLEDGNWDKANEYCERILDIEPKNANAYLGKLMIEYRIKQKSDLATCKKDFEQTQIIGAFYNMVTLQLYRKYKSILLKLKNNKE